MSVAAHVKEVAKVRFNCDGRLVPFLTSTANREILQFIRRKKSVVQLHDIGGQVRQSHHAVASASGAVYSIYFDCSGSRRTDVVEWTHSLEWLLRVYATEAGYLIQSFLYYKPNFN